jgi:hypothetical protein
MASTAVHTLLDFRRNSSPRDRESRWSGVFAGAFAALAACLVAAGPARAAPAAVGGVKTTSNPLVSSRYQAFSCDTAAVRASSQRPAVAEGAHGAHAAQQAGTGPISGLKSARAGLQYQMRKAIPHSSRVDSIGFQRRERSLSSRSCSQNASPISETSLEPSLPADGRRLLQLALAFALAYVVFLTAWFWSTRERRSRVGRAARS